VGSNVVSKFKGTPEEQLALGSYVKLIRGAASLETRLFRRLAGEAPELTASQFGVLEMLLHLGPLHQCELARRILKSSGNMTLVIDNLEKRGLVRRERSSEDRRFIEVHLTEDGEALIRRIFPGHAAAITAELSVLTPEEQRLLGELCRRVGLADQAIPAAAGD
jgi:MarR family 2-MHQ and catechol resistance regulon transcriptional repressor